MAIMRCLQQERLEWVASGLMHLHVSNLTRERQLRQSCVLASIHTVLPCCFNWLQVLCSVSNRTFHTANQ